MKATGIVRRIDNLGRVVIPKEIRRVFEWKEGEPLEIFVDEGGRVVLRKFEPEPASLAQYSDAELAAEVERRAQPA